MVTGSRAGRCFQTKPVGSVGNQSHENNSIDVTNHKDRGRCVVETVIILHDLS